MEAPDDESVNRIAPGSVDRAFFGHPRGLSTLFFAEMGERFSYYGMRALLILFMTAAPAAGGLGFDTETACTLYGLYTSMVYFAAVPGGWIADHLIGQRRSVFYGGILIACGHFSMVVHSLATFYLGLLFIVLGTGLLKGNISVLVGQLYLPDDYRRDAGFAIYYMGINLGAFFAPLICGYLGQQINWHLGFAAAGLGMLLGLTIYTAGVRHLGDPELHAITESNADTSPLSSKAKAHIGVSALALVVVAVLISDRLPITLRQIADAAGYILLATAAIFFAWLFCIGNRTPAERMRLYVIGVFFVAAVIFWSEFEQAGSTLNLFADRNTRTAVLGVRFPSSWFQSLSALFIIIFAPMFAWLWVHLGPHQPSTPVKLATGLIGVGAGFALLVPAARTTEAGFQVSPMWLIATYLMHTFAELCFSPVGLSSMTKLAPARSAGTIMGVWFLGAAIGNFVGGRLASTYEAWPLPNLFGIIAAFGIVSGVVLMVFSPRIKEWMSEVT